MKVFISHSSRQKLFARELIRRLPSSVEVWIDEKDIPVGASIDSRITDALKENLLAVVLIVDHHSATSAWVRREVETTLEAEKQSSEILLIPIVLEPDAVSAIDYFNLRDRKYLSCYDFSEETIDGVARQLVSSLFEKSSAKIAALSARNRAQPGDDLAEAIRGIVFPYRAINGLPIPKLTRLLEDKGYRFSTPTRLLEKLEELRNASKLTGLYFDEDEIFLCVENVADKRHLNEEEKKRIGRCGARLVVTGMSIAVDTGSTTLAFTEHLARRVGSRSLKGISVYTNSVPAANRLVDELCASKVDDDDRLCRVCLIGGWCRPTSQGTIPFSDDYERYLPSALDIAVMGCNGVVKDLGFGNSTQAMIQFKQEVIRRAKRVIFLVEGQKFAISQDILIHEFGPSVEVITGDSAAAASAIGQQARSRGVIFHEA